ncbi:unnamed protein product [Brassica rapa]|uniref:Uncharacterized protein n=1 Tax=Brassica campestris TaxID=3711 RepID=A0A8D9GUK2_BRACM|nr:unnamed protein product [Brassica rapa]
MDFTFSRIAAGNDGGSFKPMVSAATCSGSLHVLTANLVEGAEIEEGKIRRVCDDGRVNVVTVENGEGSLMGMGLWAIEL